MKDETVHINQRLPVLWGGKRTGKEEAEEVHDYWQVADQSWMKMEQEQVMNLKKMRLGWRYWRVMK